MACQTHTRTFLCIHAETHGVSTLICLLEKEREIESYCALCILSLGLLFCPSRRSTKRRHEGVEINKVKRSGQGSALFLRTRAVRKERQLGAERQRLYIAIIWTREATLARE